MNAKNFLFVLAQIARWARGRVYWVGEPHIPTTPPPFTPSSLSSRLPRMLLNPITSSQLLPKCRETLLGIVMEGPETPLQRMQKLMTKRQVYVAHLPWVSLSVIRAAFVSLLELTTRAHCGRAPLQQ
ncbi:hypothetical protein mRhiFer1_009433 [Rhinolophus ferrumequinum]|uniref:Uncharacterized protein n=1 Tax=Rhinolophus ferrumequinum TaxID=59479 RepID=A0A7J7RJ71_RHIFE|nr:hypothetical protein mRhiFer1_009433 [Rhinolophus ferrumequinum]